MRRALTAGVAIAALASAVPAGAATKRVSVGDDFFGPTALTVSKNTKVKWVWTGDEQHNVSVQSGPVSFRSPLQDSGTYKRKMTKKGTYQLLCTVHAPDMAMTLTVK